MAVSSPIVITGSRITSNYGNGTVIFRKKDFEARIPRYSLSEHFITEKIVPADRRNSKRNKKRREKKKVICYLFYKHTS